MSSPVRPAAVPGVPCFLADTWWFALTGRVTDDRFTQLARLRAEQGFTAVQLVVGIPPEVGPGNRDAWSPVGPAWFPDGRPNPGYLEHARSRIQYLNSLGITAVVYGCWGHQLAWLGRDGARAWWARVVAALDDLDVVYCVSGETNLWIGTEDALLPDRTTGDLLATAARARVPGRVQALLRRSRAQEVLRRSRAQEVLRRSRRGYVQVRHAAAVQARRDGWDEVLRALAAATDRSLLAHVVPGETSADALAAHDLLAAVTVQTGHDQASRPLLWEWPARCAARFPGRPFVNLEPWYEGIRDDFATADQLFAYWVSMLSGAAAYCYGAHGMWNAGDGAFLAHWGKQSLDTAAALPTPALLGASHRVFLDAGGPDPDGVTTVDVVAGTLRSITRTRADGTRLTFLPDAARVPAAAQAPPARDDGQADGRRRYFAPATGTFLASPLARGPLVVLTGLRVPR